MLREEQIDLRRQRARAANLAIENVGKNRVFSDYRVTNPQTKGQYTVAVRGFDTGDNTCTCPDFKANTLGTCKHIEAVLDALKDDLPPHLRKKKAAVGRPEIYLHYVEEVPEEVTVLSDALDFVDREIERAEMAKREQAWLGQLDAGTLDLTLLPI